MSRDYAAMSDPARNTQFNRTWTEPSREGLRPVGKVATSAVNNTAARAVARWLQRADQLDGQDRFVCLQTADAIMQTAGLQWADFAIATMNARGGREEPCDRFLSPPPA